VRNHENIAAVGHYSALFATLPVASERAQSMLPPGVSLGAQSLTPPGQHPLLLMFGHHTHVHPAFLDIGGWSYHEFLVAIPWVTKGGSATVWSHMPRLYLDSWAMVLAGWLYAFPKMRARIAAPADAYGVRTWIAGGRRISARWQLEGDAGPASAFPDFAGVAPTFAQPFIQRFTPLPFVASTMAFDLASATLQAATASVEIDDAFVPGLPTGSFSFPSIAGNPLGAFTIDVPWTLSWPRFGG
jgi:hypothetical protein